MRIKGLYQRPGSPSWMMRYADENGRIVRVSTNTTEKKLAAAILAKRRTAVAENRHLDIKRLPNISFHKLCKDYWELHGKNLRHAGVWYMLEIVKDEIGDPPLKDVTQQRIERLLMDLHAKRKFSERTRNEYLTRIKCIFAKALEWGMVEVNPATAIKNLHVQQGRVRFLSTDEIGRLLAAASRRFRQMLIVALHTGMRKGEIFKLRWPDIDFHARIVNVHQKTKTSKNRAVPMSETLYETLRDMKPGTVQHNKLVFPSQLTAAELVSIDSKLARLLAKAKIEDFTFHGLRHTFASHLVMRGVDLKAVSELLGHASIEMTMIYAHLAPGHRAKAVRALDAGYTTGTKTDTVEKRSEEDA